MNITPTLEHIVHRAQQHSRSPVFAAQQAVRLLADESFAHFRFLPSDLVPIFAQRFSIPEERAVEYLNLAYYAELVRSIIRHTRSRNRILRQDAQIAQVCQVIHHTLAQDFFTARGMKLTHFIAPLCEEFGISPQAAQEALNLQHR